MKLMNGLDRLFINVETPELPMDMLGILLLDPSTAPDGLDYRRFRAEMSVKVAHLPLFTRRAVWAPWGAGHEHWLRDPDFDIDRHLKHVGAPAPYDLSALCQLAITLVDEPLDHRRPLWQMFYVDGLHDGGAAILLRLHHAAIDGVGGSEMLRVLFDAEPMPFDADQRPPRIPGERVPTPVEMLIRSVPGQLMTPYRLASRALPIAAPLTKTMLAKMVPDLADAGRRQPTNKAAGAAAQVPVAEGRNLLNRRAATSKRSLAVASLAMSDLITVKNHFATTLNDVVLSVTSAAVADYLRARGELSGDKLRIAAPVNVRDDDAESASGNHFAFMMVSIPDITDPVQRLRTVAGLTAKARPRRTRANESTRTTRKTTGMVSSVMGLIDALPSGVWQAVGQLVNSAVIDAMPPIANFVVSNIPGPTEPLYISGARITHMYGRTMVGAGIGLFIHCLSYGDNLDFGFTALADLVPDPELIADAMRVHLDDLMTAASSSPEAPPAHRTDTPTNARPEQ